MVSQSISTKNQFRDATNIVPIIIYSHSVIFMFQSAFLKHIALHGRQIIARVWSVAKPARNAADPPDKPFMGDTNTHIHPQFPEPNQGNPLCRPSGAKSLLCNA